MKILLLICLLSACALKGTGGPRAATLTTPTLRVENNNWSGVIVYFLPTPGASPSRIGRVESLRKDTLRLPPLTSSWRLGLRFLASRNLEWWSESLWWATTYDCLLLVVENMLSASHVVPCR